MINSVYLESVIKQLEYYKMQGEKALAQIPDDKLHWQINHQSNSVGIIVKHLSGNMRSRWSDLLTTDGDKPWRDREAEFENDVAGRAEVLNKWNEGWSICLSALHALTVNDLEKIIYIRNEAHCVMEAINRQLAHYAYHVGQIVFIAKIVATDWQSLTIPKGGSKTFNETKFKQAPHRRHFTDDQLNKKID